MTQAAFGNRESPLSGTALINTYLEPALEAILSGHSGASRPSYAVAGMSWINTTTNPWVLNLFDGVNDATLGTVNPTTHAFTPNLPDATRGDIQTSSTGSVWTIIASAITTNKILNGAVTLAKLATQAANTVLVNATSGAASPTALVLAASQLLGRGSAGDIAPISVGSGLSMTGNTLSATAAAAPITKSYASGLNAFSNAALITLPHGMAALPLIIQAYAVCQTAEFGYSVGDMALVNMTIDSQGTGNGIGMSVVPDATNLNIRIANAGLALANKTTGAPTTITPANWRLVFRAFA